MLRVWSTSCGAELGALIPVLCLCCRWSPHSHLCSDATKHRSAWTRKFPLPSAPSLSALSDPAALNHRCWGKSEDLQRQSHVSRRHGTLVTPNMSGEEGGERLYERLGWQSREWGFGGGVLSWKMWRWDEDRKVDRERRWE